MTVKPGNLFEILSRVSRRLWNVRRRLLINVPIFVQKGIDEETIDKWSEELSKYSGELFARGINVIPGKTVVLIGPAGSGRSELVNRVLELDKEKLPSHPERGERLPILVIHSSKKEYFDFLRDDCNVLYLNLDKRSDEEESRDCLNYEEARNRAISEQENAGWLIWFVDSELIKNANIVLPPAIQSVRFWLNAVIEQIVSYADIKILFDDKYIDWFSGLSGNESGKSYVVGDRKSTSSQEYGFISMDEIYSNFGKIIEGEYSIEERNRNIENIDKILRESQKLRGEIESILSDILTREDVDRIATGPIDERFDYYINMIVMDLENLMDRFIAKKNLKLKIQSALGKVLKNYVKISGKMKFLFLGALLLLFIVVIIFKLFGDDPLFAISLTGILLVISVWLFLNREKEKYLALDSSLESTFLSDFDRELKNMLSELKEDFLKDIEKYTEDSIRAIFTEDVDKDFIRLEWPAIVLYSHLVRNPGDFIDKTLHPEVREIIEDDTELASYIGYSTSRSIFWEGFDIGEEFKSMLIDGIQAEINDIVNMFVFEEINFVIARERLYNYVFEAVESFKDKVDTHIKMELERLKKKYMARYNRVVGFRHYLINPVLLQEALAKARMEMDDAIDMLSSIL